MDRAPLMAGGRGRRRVRPNGDTPLINSRLDDGSRHFALLPESAPSFRLLLHVFTLWGAYPTAFATDAVFESWLGFRYKGYAFSVNNQMQEWWFFVENPQCPEHILRDVARHFAKLLRARSN